MKFLKDAFSAICFCLVGLLALLTGMLILAIPLVILTALVGTWGTFGQLVLFYSFCGFLLIAILVESYKLGKDIFRSR